MKILLIWNSQVIGHCGGMERVMINFANEMTARGHQVSLVYCTEKKGRALLCHRSLRTPRQHRRFYPREKMGIRQAAFFYHKTGIPSHLQ